MPGRTATAPAPPDAKKSKLMRLIETGRVDLLPMATHRFSFEKIEKAFHMIDKKEDGMIKPLIAFG
jgi:isopropanol dehydrogenase (NADP+)